MKAIVKERYGTSEVLELREVERPEPGEGEVLVRVEAASLNTADLDQLRGTPRIVRLGTGIGRPRNPRIGLDVAGRVEAVGPKVAGLQSGDEVWADLFSYGQGSLAEYVCAPAGAFTVKPSAVSFEEAAAVPHSGLLAVQGLLSNGPILPGQKVLINGAGGCVGPFAIQIAKHFGAEVTGVDHRDKVELVRSLEADHVIDYTQESLTGNGQRYDLVLDIAGRCSLIKCRSSLSDSGRYVQIARTLTGFMKAALLGPLIGSGSDRTMGRVRLGAEQGIRSQVPRRATRNRPDPIIDRPTLPVG